MKGKLHDYTFQRLSLQTPASGGFRALDSSDLDARSHQNRFERVTFSASSLSKARSSVKSTNCPLTRVRLPPPSSPLDSAPDAQIHDYEGILPRHVTPFPPARSPCVSVTLLCSSVRGRSGVSERHTGAVLGQGPTQPRRVALLAGAPLG